MVVKKIKVINLTFLCVHYTDFNSSRGEMLKKEIKVSNSKKQIEEIFAAELAENVKKGWNKV